VEFGFESSAAIFQSMNLQFHRASMYSAILAQRVLSLCGASRECVVCSVRPVRSPKQVWFEALVLTRP
jgi:hypothetical protein